MNKEEILKVLLRDPDFAKFPPEWQSQIADEIVAGKGADAFVNFGVSTETTPLTIQNIPQLAPQLMNEWNRVRALGDRRSWEQWAADHSRVDPNWLASVQYLAPQKQTGLTGTDEQNAALANWRRKVADTNTTLSAGNENTVNLEQDLLERTVNRGYADMENDAARQKWARDLVAEYDRTFAGANQTIADLYNGNRLTQEQEASTRATNELLGNVSQNTSERNAALAALVNSATEGLRTQVDARGLAINQQEAARRQALADLVAAERAAIQTDVSERGASLQSELATRRDALAKSIADLTAAQEPLNAERIKAAQTQATAVNLAAQQARDQAVAQAAQDGYVGSSSGGDAAMARAMLAGRQGAAEQLGMARVANASDMAGIGRYGATERRALGDYGAIQNRQVSDYGTGQRRSLADLNAGETRSMSDSFAKDRRDLSDFSANEGRNIASQGAAQRYNIANENANLGMTIRNDGSTRRFDLFSNDLNRRLANLNTPATLFNSRINLANAAEDFGNSGFNRTMDSLNRFRTSGAPAPSLTPNLTTANTTMGNGLQNLGGGLAGAGFSMMNSYFSNQRNPTNPTPAGGATTTPTGMGLTQTYNPGVGSGSNSFLDWRPNP